MNRVFGEGAAWYAARLPASDDGETTIVFELAHIAAALPAMVAARFAGRQLTIAPYITAPRPALVERLAAPIFAQHRETEARATALAAYAAGTLVVSGRRMSEIGPYDPRDLVQLREAFALADWVIVPSRAAAFTLETLAGAPIRSVLPLQPPDTSILPRANGETIVIWDRSGSAALRAWYTFALRALAAPVVVAGPGEESVLEGARSVVVTEATTPLEAWRLHACGAALVVERNSGAHEWLEGVVCYDRADTAGIARAVRVACGIPPARQRPRGLTTTQPTPVPAAPAARATFIVRTKDRPALLERALASVERQTHPETRAIVVNDGGASVAELVRRFPRATLIERERSDVRTAAGLGLAAAADADFVALLDDDDALAPDFLNATIAALERSGADLAVCGAVHVYRADGDDRLAAGLAVFAPPSLERSALAVNNLIPGVSRVLIRRVALERAGGFNADLPLSEDHELWLRLSRTSEIVRVATVATAYSVFPDGRNRSLAAGARHTEALRTIYALHPIGDRPAVAGARSAVLAEIERVGGYPLSPATRNYEPPLALEDLSS